jgi:hypothetical protein
VTEKLKSTFTTEVKAVRGVIADAAAAISGASECIALGATTDAA